MVVLSVLKGDILPVLRLTGVEGDAWPSAESDLDLLKNIHEKKSDTSFVMERIKKPSLLYCFREHLRNLQISTYETNNKFWKVSKEVNNTEFNGSFNSIKNNQR